jgi:hypothetical protein
MARTIRFGRAPWSIRCHLIRFGTQIEQLADGRSLKAVFQHLHIRVLKSAIACSRVSP